MAIRAHVDWLKEGVSRWNRRRKRVNFSPDLSGTKFFDLLPPDFRDDPKTSRTFERIDLSNADLEGADLSNLNFRKANFDGANLRNAEMSLSNFDEAKFRGANLSGSKVSNSSFEEATLDEISLDSLENEGTDLRGATFLSTDVPDERRVRFAAQGAQFNRLIERFEDNLKHEMRSHILRRLSDVPPDDHPSSKTPKNRYDVFFGTNRQAIFQRGALSGFSGDKSTDIHYGLCEVIVPEGHRIGSLGSPLWKRLLNMKDDRLDIESLIGLDEELFFNLLRASSAKMRVQSVPTIFIHGFNNSFEAAVLRAAQIGFDLGIGQGVGLFSWPSKAKKRAYSADEASAEASKYLLADFMEKFISNMPMGRVNVIAHSMGCRCLLGALEVLSNGRKSTLRRVNQVILAAADVDTSIMPHLAVAATNYSTRTTSYVSGHDRALKLSGWLHSYPRVGFIPPTFVMSGMDTVLVNDDDLGTLSHGYVGSSRTVLKDIFDLLSNDDAPASRFGLEAVKGGYWRIKN